MSELVLETANFTQIHGKKVQNFGLCRPPHSEKGPGFGPRPPPAFKKLAVALNHPLKSRKTEL